MTGGAGGAAQTGRRKGACGAAPLGEGGGARILAVDVGTGTADILLTLPGEPLENSVKLVVPSRTQVVGAQIAQATRRGQTVIFSGPTMGGGACGAAMKRHLAAGQAFVATEEAAFTFADDLDKVRALGARIVGDAAAAELTARMPVDSVAALRSGDLDPGALRDALDLLGADPRFDAVAVAVQDHGFSPNGSNRVFRFAFWEAALRERRPIGDLFYDAADAPAEFTRLRAAAALAAELSCGGPALVADTGPAALYGALPEGVADAVLVNVGNGHTICVVTLGGRLAGVFEHHTSALDGPRLEDFLQRFLAGHLDSDEVRGDGGHGAVIGPDGRAADLTQLPMYATGPRRALLAGSALPLEHAAPHGDMMLTGCFGLLRAFADRGATPGG
ncbi:MAG TPA: DUF1786 family protein [Thermoleophilia bacterium]|nr:DUF1786 family protein [Thermoleophilia bacterium]